MMRQLRRFLVIASLMFWLGGFTFYVSVVVPVGAAVLHSHLRQGMITRQVTVWLNVAGAIGLLVLLWDMLAAVDPARWRFRLRVGSWLFMVACQAGLFALHGYLDSMLDVRAMKIIDPDFYLAHRFYLWAQTLQWLGGLLFIALMLAAWRAEDSWDRPIALRTPAS